MNISILNKLRVATQNFSLVKHTTHRLKDLFSFLLVISLTCFAR